MNHAIALRCGTLRIRVDRADLPFDHLCGFASRRSRKRGFVFVSKVLGKHYPAKPSTIADVHSRLAGKLADIAGPILFIGLAETATALGHGIFQAWSDEHGRADACYQHSTRYRLHHPLALNFDESHSHATEHLLYRPSDETHASVFRKASTLVLIDDEMSTGRTLVKLAHAYRQQNPMLRAIHLVCITDWLGDARRDQIVREIGLPTYFQSLLQGEYALDENTDFDPGPVPNAGGPGDFKDAYLPNNFGRLGVDARLNCDLDAKLDTLKLTRGDRILVLGTGEFAYPPFLLASRLETLGHDVRFQTTTRSPLMIDRDITSVLEFADNYYDGIANYLYNVADRRYDRIVVGYETSPLPAEHRLAETLDATSIFF